MVVGAPGLDSAAQDIASWQEVCVFPVKTSRTSQHRDWCEDLEGFFSSHPLSPEATTEACKGHPFQPHSQEKWFCVDKNYTAYWCPSKCGH